MEIKKSKLQFIVINHNNNGRRVDNFLITQLPGLPKNLIYRILRKGNIRINKKRIQPHYKLKHGDQIKIPPLYINDININKHNINQLHLKKISVLNHSIIYEDDFMLVLNKPSGIAVHGGSGLSFGVIEALRFLRPQNNYLELVHRLDRETSGILLIAKKKSALLFLHKQLREKTMQKTYIALVHGNWPKELKKIKIPLLKITTKNKPNMMCVHDTGKLSETHFVIKTKFLSCTLLNITPITGKTHQIRIHAQNAGFPIIFDKKYGDDRLDDKLKINSTCNRNRLFLHAQSIIFRHPNNGKKLCFQASIDENLQSYLKMLNKTKL